MATKPTEIAVGDVITGTGSKTVYYGLPQLQNSTYEKVSDSELTLTATPKTIAALTTADIATYVEIAGLRVTKVDGTTITVTDGTDSIQIYKAKFEDVVVDDVITVKGAVGIYNGTFQLRNTVASEITVTKEAPVCQTIAEALAAVIVAVPSAFAVKVFPESSTASPSTE